jgi:structure-specific recognition protein 1
MKGWNWGHYELLDAEMTFKVNDKTAFTIPYQDIQQTAASGKNECTIEFVQEPSSKDQLCELRFYLPQSELDDTRNSSDSDDQTAAKCFNTKL